MKRLLGWGLVGWVACASSPDYVPEERASATLGGRTAAQYLLPSDIDVQADVRIASFGFIEARAERREEPFKALHLRFNVSNEGEQQVLLDSRQQVVEGPAGGRSAPGYVTSTEGEPPVVEVPPGQSRTLDLFYEVPQAHADTPNPQDFMLHWIVSVGGETIRRSTPFHQVAVDPAIAQQEALERYPYGWADPYYGPWIGWGPWGYWYR